MHGVVTFIEKHHRLFGQLTVFVHALRSTMSQFQEETLRAGVWVTLVQVSKNFHKLRYVGTIRT